MVVAKCGDNLLVLALGVTRASDLDHMSTSSDLEEEEDSMSSDLEHTSTSSDLEEGTSNDRVDMKL